MYKIPNRHSRRLGRVENTTLINYPNQTQSLVERYTIEIVQERDGGIYLKPRKEDIVTRQEAYRKYELRIDEDKEAIRQVL